MIIAVDTGGTKTLVAAFTDDGKIHREIKFPTPKNKQDYISQLTDTVEEVAQEAKIDIIVVAVPGIVKNGVALWCKNLLWTDFDVQGAVQKRFPEVPVHVENDANLGGMGEVRRLNPMPESALYITISTGIGTGFILNGQINSGLRHSESGHALVEYDGVVQEWEEFGAGSSVYRVYGKYARDIHDAKTWRQIADRFSRGFLALIPITQPEIIIIGGSMGTYFNRYKDFLIGYLRERLPAHIAVPHFQEAKDAEKAVIYGCYFYGYDFITRKTT